MVELCPTCGQAIRVVSGDEGTNHYAPLEHQLAGRYREALEAARDALADPNAMAEDTDSPANMAFAIVNHALAPSPRKAERP